MQEKGKNSNLLSESSIALKPKPESNIPEKKTTDQYFL